MSDVMKLSTQELTEEILGEVWKDLQLNLRKSFQFEFYFLRDDVIRIGKFHYEISVYSPLVKNGITSDRHCSNEIFIKIYNSLYVYQHASCEIRISLANPDYIKEIIGICKNPKEFWK